MRWRRYLIILMSALVWCLAILSFPWLLRSGYVKVSVAISLFFSKLCHQIATRSFGIGGLTFPVCSRCLGLYAGTLAGILISPVFMILSNFANQIKVLLIVGIAFIALDIGLDWLNVASNTFITRTLTGSLLGLSLGLVLAMATQGVPLNGKAGKGLDDR